MSLRNGKLIKCYSWDDIPMMQEFIDQVLEFGEKENAPEGVIIRDGRGNVEHHDFEYDDIKGVYGYDLQRNLYPQTTTMPKTRLKMVTIHHIQTVQEAVTLKTTILKMNLMMMMTILITIELR